MVALRLVDAELPKLATDGAGTKHVCKHHAIHVDDAQDYRNHGRDGSVRRVFRVEYRDY